MTGLPPVDEVTAPWWDATRERRLLLQHCTGCGTVQHHPRSLCTGCGRTDALDWITAGGTGAVDTYTVVHRAPAPDVRAPYVIARVRLAEGPVLLARLVGTARDVQAGGELIDVAVELTWEPLPDGRNLPVFTVRAHELRGS